MQWEQLLSLRRHGDKQKRLRTDQDPTRSGFEVDYDRIIFSAAFRNLQDKTQVIPFSKTDFVHTRLTHSLEVSVVGRSLGRMVGQQLLHKYPELATLGYTSNDFGAIVAAASLAHDIGNPPFGHSGEQAIGDYFSNGKGAVHSFVIMHRLFHPAFQEDVPYNLTVVQLDEGPRVTSIIIGTNNEEIEVGMNVSANWHDVNGTPLLHFEAS